ncbi:MAG: DUF6288 domain-containing protein [Planctomycetota bacterium]|nr:DUF6288 domain-containing protein [Planctomycetota bacterium]
MIRNSLTAVAGFAAMLVLGVASNALAAPGSLNDALDGSSYYKVHPQFHPYPDEKKTWTITHFGPVGIGLDLIQPAFTMRILNVEKDSPAAAAGMLKAGQIIESINGKTLKDIDPRVILGNIITEAEATDGLLKMMVKEKPDAAAQEVIVKIPVLGAYSETWPLNCKKSDRIVRNFAELLAKHKKPRWGSVLFLLSTGEEKDLDVVRGWLKDCEGIGAYPWHKGMLGPGLCEYYLRTGDSSILPVIKKMTDELKEMMYSGGWSGRGHAGFTYMAGGHMNAAGVHCVTFLLLARQCGVEVDEYTLQTSLKHFYRYAGHGNVPYGDHWPEGGFRDNGKTGGLALTMSAAALLSPEGESSVYAKARDNSAMKSFYATSWFMAGHTGGGIGEIWHGAAMGIMPERKPIQYRSFMDERRWLYELSRRVGGSIGISGGEGYDKSASESSMSWGTYHALVYTLPRKKLRLAGAPKTQWCKTYSLPNRPWGNAADDAFQSNEPAEYRPGKVQDLSNERVPTDASWPVLRRLNSPDVSDDTLLMYAHHPEFGVRVMAARAIAEHGSDHLIVELLKSKDPRMRHTGLLPITGMFKGRPLPAERVTDEMFDLVSKMLSDPDESWWVTQAAMQAIARAKPERIVSHMDQLVSFLEHEDWWLHTTAMLALKDIATDERFYMKVMPTIAELIRMRHDFQSTGPVGAIARNLQTASPEVQKFGLKLFADAYASIPEPVVAPTGKITGGQTEVLRGRAYSFIADVPGSDELLLVLPKLSSTWQATGKQADKYVYDGKFIANKKVLGTWRVVDQVATVDEFKIQKKMDPGRSPFTTITFKDGGETDNAKRLWTGDTLIDVGRGEALKMAVKQVELPQNPKAPKVDLLVNDADDHDLDLEVEIETEEKTPRKIGPTEPYLFIEAGGFRGSQPKDWKTPYFVLKKSK